MMRKLIFILTCLMLLLTRIAWSQPTWIEAEDLKPGYLVLLADGSVQKVEMFEVQDKTTPVYNFEVEGIHTYYVSEEGVLVHNTKCWNVNGNSVRMVKNKDGFDIEVNGQNVGDVWLGSDGYLYGSIIIPKQLRGQKIYKSIIKEASNHYKPKGMKGIWNKPEPGDPIPETNYEVFQQLRKQGYSNSAAALDTPTGRAARNAGFEKVKNVQIDPTDGSISATFYH